MSRALCPSAAEAGGVALKWVISIVILLITLPITTHEPPSRVWGLGFRVGYREQFWLGQMHHSGPSPGTLQTLCKSPQRERLFLSLTLKNLLEVPRTPFKTLKTWSAHEKKRKPEP